MCTSQHAAVLGGGLMGHGIAQVFARGGYDVRVYDPSPSVRDSLIDRVRDNLRGLGLSEEPASRIQPCASIEQAVSGAFFVTEAALEDLGAKRALFAEAERLASPDAILASNTSVIPITDIMSALNQRERGIGTHWWNPPFLVPLVEVIGTEWTSGECLETTLALLTDLGKTAVHVRKDVPGFVGNRLQHALWREAIALVEEGICDAETVDTVVKNSFGLRLAVLGPLENADLVGTDLTLAIHETVLPSICSEAGPSGLLRTLVADGRLGMKSGRGFRDWTLEAQAALRKTLVVHLQKGVGQTQSQSDPS